MLDYIVMQIRKTNREKGYCGKKGNCVHSALISVTKCPFALLPNVNNTRVHLRPEMILIRSTPNFNIQNKVSL